jgi:hypothetical protein
MGPEAWPDLVIAFSVGSALAPGAVAYAIAARLVRNPAFRTRVAALMLVAYFGVGVLLLALDAIWVVMGFFDKSYQATQQNPRLGAWMCCAVQWAAAIVFAALGVGYEKRLRGD